MPCALIAGTNKKCVHFSSFYLNLKHYKIFFKLKNANGNFSGNKANKKAKKTEITSNHYRD